MCGKMMRNRFKGENNIFDKDTSRVRGEVETFLKEMERRSV
jgi:hypothetical protein